MSMVVSTPARTNVLSVEAMSTSTSVKPPDRFRPNDGPHGQDLGLRLMGSVALRPVPLPEYGISSKMVLGARSLKNQASLPRVIHHDGVFLGLNEEESIDAAERCPG